MRAFIRLTSKVIAAISVRTMRAASFSCLARIAISVRDAMKSCQMIRKRGAAAVGKKLEAIYKYTLAMAREHKFERKIVGQKLI